MYRMDKFDMRKRNFYYNSKGSALIFEARAGCLRTKSFVGKYAQYDVWSVEKKQTIRHIVLDCDCSQPNPYEGNIHLRGLTNPGAAKVNYKAVEVTERSLECWQRQSREGGYSLRQLPLVQNLI